MRLHHKRAVWVLVTLKDGLFNESHNRAMSGREVLREIPYGGRRRSVDSGQAIHPQAKDKNHPKDSKNNCVWRSWFAAP